MSWHEDNPKIQTVQCGASDLNGQLRGKRAPAEMVEKVLKDGVRFPLSAFNLDIWGEDIEDSPMVFESGDADGTIMPTERGITAIPYLSTPSALIPLWAFNDDGTPFMGDPRQALKSVVDRYAALGLTPVVATEMEFYLIDDSGDDIQPPASLRSGKNRPGGDVLSLTTIDEFNAFFDDLYAACADMNIPADAATSESGAGQFEITINHAPDALKAADDAWLFKLLVQGLARKHGLAGSFMAKPFADQAGNGLHTHFSILDKDGNNVLADGSDEGTPMLRNAVAGCLKGLAELNLIFAPHANSYDRLVPGAHAPTNICWGYDNRTAAIRIPGGSPKARRIEHRLAGGDVSPHLFLAAVLGSALIGLEQKLDAPAPMTGNAYDQDFDQVSCDWAESIETFANSKLAAEIFDPILIDNLVRTKRQEMKTHEKLTDQERILSYLDRV